MTQIASYDPWFEIAKMLAAALVDSGRERDATLAWLRGEAATAAYRSEIAAEDMVTEYCSRAEALIDAANAIERGDHLPQAEEL